MKYLLDTNILIWLSQSNPLLPDEFKEIILSPENTSMISIVSLWEIGIKYSLKKLSLQKPLDILFSEIYQTDFMDILELKTEHILKSVELPFYHRDPFDRLLYAQAKAENMSFLYTDKIFDKYNT